MQKRIFIASSTEGLDVAYAIQENLEYYFEITVWPQGVFEPSKTSIESLFKQTKIFDAAVFVFTPDDEVISRNKSKQSVRDNVIFELGLFIGALGRESCFIVKPRSFSNLDLPTDLLGVTSTDYQGERSDGNLCAALGPSSNKIKRVLIPREDPVGKLPASLSELLTTRPYRLFFNPETKRSKRVVFSPDGYITEGNNRNEHKWRISNQNLELLQLDGAVHSRFSYDSKDDLFQHTNDQDTLSIRNQFIVPDNGSDKS
ncbi:nucleotide-binding protein [uncultured Methylophaga sp.]|uniref:nucleotide-binding protein n=1 Tax=uncultured Methylophaga sp. TaxID=285271 RepID=UPI002628C7C1|nr:nucleotide-binding protein [uncultured Methylophaga sp.]